MYKKGKGNMTLYVFTDGTGHEQAYDTILRDTARGLISYHDALFEIKETMPRKYAMRFQRTARPMHSKRGRVTLDA